MTLRHIKIFEAVYRHCNITKAAEELHLAQPSVSLAVKELEEHYNVRLFERLGRRICPTACGETLYGYARHILSLFAEMEGRLGRWDREGIVRVGASITIGAHILPALLKRYRERFPDLRVEVAVGKSGDMEERLRNSTLDIGLLERQPHHPELEALPLLEDSMCAIVPRGHPLAACPRVSLSQLAEWPLLMRERGSACREQLDAAYALQQRAVRPLWESASAQAIIRAVAAGLGVSVLPQRLVEGDGGRDQVVLLPLQQPLTRHLNLVLHKNKYITPPLRALMDLCRQYGAEQSGGGESAAAGD